MLTEQQLEDVFFQVTKLATGFTDDYIRIAYQPTSQPAWEITENVVIFNVSVQEDDWSKYRDIIYTNQDASNAESVIIYTRVLKVDWSIYGPDAMTTADNIRNGILLESVRSYMMQSKIAPLTKVPDPRKVPYLQNGQWWKRFDQTAFFNNQVKRTGTTPYFASADVSISDTGGHSSLIQLP